MRVDAALDDATAGAAAGARRRETALRSIFRGYATRATREVPVGGGRMCANRAQKQTVPRNGPTHQSLIGKIFSGPSSVRLLAGARTS